MTAQISAMAANASSSTPDLESGSAARAVALDMLDIAKYVEYGNIDAPSSSRVASGGLVARASRASLRRIIRTSLTATCLDGSVDASYISSLFHYGGEGTAVYLCKGVTLTITEPIWFSAPRQILATQGLPTGGSRATIVVAGKDQSCAIMGAIPHADGITLASIQVDGARDTLGRIEEGLALIEMGGHNQGQIVDSIRAYEPRGWSVLHLAEGTNNACGGMIVQNSQFGPAGHGPSGELQFRKRDAGDWAPGQWADGISLACANSLVVDNTITDATDGGIVIFGAVGSTVRGNKIKAVDRQLLGGINLVDWAPFAGTFEGVTVDSNQIIAEGSMIKLGIAMGGMTWGIDNRTSSRTWGGTVTNNVFKSTSKDGVFGYAIGISGHERAKVTGNTADEAYFGGVESPSCFRDEYPLPRPQPFIADPFNAPGNTLQPEFTRSRPIVIAICKRPSLATDPASDKALVKGLATTFEIVA